MAYALYKDVEPKAEYAYFDKQFKGTPEEYQRALALSTTIYVGNIAFATNEECALSLGCPPFLPPPPCPRPPFPIPGPPPLARLPTELLQIH